MIPIKYVYKGDEEGARGLRRFAQTQLEILRSSMKHQNLKQDKRTVMFDDGRTVKISINHGLEVANIYCPPVEVEDIGVEGITAQLVSTGSVLEQSAAIAALPVQQGCNEQGANATVDTCKGAVLPFETNLRIVGADLDLFASTLPPPKFAFQVRGGVSPYTWKVTGDDYYFIDKDDKHVKEIVGRSQAPMCVGGKYHGYYGGLDGITGMLFMLMGGAIINKDLCERAGGELYLYRGIIAVHAKPFCGATLDVEDICGNTASIELVEPELLEWIEAQCDDQIDPSDTGSVASQGGSADFTSVISGTGFWLDPGFTTKTITAGGGRTFIYTDADACGTATITITDGCGSLISREILSTEGIWELITSGCELSGIGTEVGSSGGSPWWFDYELISGGMKQTQRTSWYQVINYGGPCPGNCPEGTECIGDGTHPVPCENAPTDLLPLRIICWTAGSLFYYEWSCP